MGVHRYDTSRIESWFVYIALAPIGGGEMFVKVGISRMPLERICQVDWGSPIKIRSARFLCIGSRKQATDIEQATLEHFGVSRTRGEWLRMPVSRKSVSDLFRAVSLLSVKRAGRLMKWKRLNRDQIASAASLSWSKFNRKAA